ncbi:MAG: GguC family protein [Rhodobacteraceae bacterium]|nr:GguC family protein [Paracoccaceae bacterium]
MRLVQFRSEDGGRAVARVDGEALAVLNGVTRVADLAHMAVSQGQSLAATAEAAGIATTLSYDEVMGAGRLLPPIDLPDPAHIVVSGTGLTHTGSADTRDAMHAKVAGDDAALSDSMKIFKMGLEGGKPAPGETGVQPEWFWKGDGTILRGCGQQMESPHWADDMGEEPEIAGIYLIGPDGQPNRLGYALANELSDHVMERQNYLFLAHSKLRVCGLGPELLVGDLPQDVQGMSRIYRDGAVLWEKPFLSGEQNMTHTLANLEHHHFKYPMFRQPGQVHVHVYGTATLSFADGVRLQDGDVMEIDCARLGRPLRNPVRAQEMPGPQVTRL